MSYIVKAESAADGPKPPAYYEVPDVEVIFKDKEVRSTKPEEHYHLSPGPAPKVADVTLLVQETSENSSTTSPTLRQLQPWL